MTLIPFTGNNQTNVNRDAKYTVTAAGEVRLEYRLDRRTKELLTTDSHPKLVEMVNKIKRQVNGVPGGVFYINEYGDVLVPDGQGGSYWAGHYEGTLEFDFEGRVLGPDAPPGLEPGDIWPGPHVGIRHVLCAGLDDVKYKSRSGRRTVEPHLSDHVGTSAARATARRIAEVRGSSGRIYINESRELFAPMSVDDSAHFVYLGPLEDSAWFDPPEGFDRP